MNLRKTQEEVGIWADENFGKGPWQQPVMGISEEVGELNHALLKQWQGIRGTYEEHEESAKDAVGDIAIYIMNLCHRRGWDFEGIVETTWEKVGKRDWKKDKESGGSGEMSNSQTERMKDE